MISADGALTRRAPLVWAAVPVAAVLAAVSIGLNWGRPLLGLEVSDALLIPSVVGMFLLVPVGALIAARRPRNPIGWLLLAAGLLLVVAMLASGFGFRTLEAGAALPAAIVANWIGPWLVVAMWVLVGFITLLFPDGRLPSPRWRWFARLLATVGVCYVAVTAADAWPRRRQVTADLEQLLPFRGDTVTAALWPVFAALLAATLGALVVRYRRGGGVERAQIRWLGLAGSLNLAATALFAVERVPAPVVAVVAGVASFAPPVAIGVAILRYRLYEIDRLISRTVTYGLVVTVLVAVYTAGVLGLGTALSALTGQAGGDLVIAASTLAAVALFRPVRARVQAAVDSRFNRTGYHARRAVDGFADRIRDEVSTQAIRDELATTAGLAVQPAHASLWLAGGAPGDGDPAGVGQPSTFEPSRRP